jgi:Major Facilitator Superfamily
MHVTSLAGDGSGTVVMRKGRVMLRYVLTALLARTGDEGAKVAVMLLSLAVATPSLGGFGVACLMAPHVLAAPLMGRWIDRSPRPHLVLAVATITFAVLLAAACAGMGRIPDVIVLVLLLAAGTFGPAITGGLSSLIRQLTPEAGLPRAFGLDSLTYNLAGMAGPALAATLAVTLPREAAFAVAGIAAAAAVPLALLRPRRSVTAGATNSPAPSLLGGFRSIMSDRPLRLATIATSVAQLGLGALVVAVPLRAMLLGGTQWTGWWFAAMAFGALLGSLGWTARPASADRVNLVVMAALLVTGAALIGAALATDPWVITALMVVAGAALGPQFGALQVVRDRGAADQDRAGVFTFAAGIKLTASALGTAVAGQLAGLPPASLMLGAALIPLAVGLTGLALHPDA